jgi:hypothetical protein
MYLGLLTTVTAVFVLMLVFILIRSPFQLFCLTFAVFQTHSVLLSLAFDLSMKFEHGGSSAAGLMAVSSYSLATSRHQQAALASA